MSSNAGPTAALSYFGPTGDELLQQLNYTTHSGSISLAQFGYTYNADDMVSTLAVSTPSAQTTTYAYDTANRLVSGLIGTGSPQYVYGYDHASNLTSITPNGATQSFSYTSVNTITSGSYDANGSPTSLGGNSYKWDGENRLVRFGSPSNNTGSSFIYDGLGRLVRVVDTHAGAITADHSYTWCGAVRCLAHDNTQANSPVSTQYFGQGAIIGGTSYYYVKDQLGSVTQLVTSTGTVASQYTYDAYGNQATVSGSASDIGYAGYFAHAVSGLDFAMYRSYDPAHARWLNRDPIGEAGGVNLFAYVRGNPTSSVDPLGWCDSSNSSGGDLPDHDPDAWLLNFLNWFGSHPSWLMAIEAMNGAMNLGVGQGTAAAGVESATAQAEETAINVPTLEELLMPNGTPLGQAGSAGVRQITGDLNDAQRLFDQLTQGGTAVGNSTYPGVLFQLQDGSTIGLRTIMTRSPGTIATIDVNAPNIPFTKIKVNP